MKELSLSLSLSLTLSPSLKAIQFDQTWVYSIRKNFPAQTSRVCELLGAKRHKTPGGSRTHNSPSWA